MKKDNHYIYETIEGTVKGFFNIYQSKSGAIYLQMARSYTMLTLGQILDLGINICMLKDFDIDLFNEMYYTKKITASN